MLYIAGYAALAAWLVAPMSERTKRILWIFIAVAVCACYLGAGYSVAW